METMVELASEIFVTIQRSYVHICVSHVRKTRIEAQLVCSENSQYLPVLDQLSGVSIILKESGCSAKASELAEMVCIEPMLKRSVAP